MTTLGPHLRPGDVVHVEGPVTVAQVTPRGIVGHTADGAVCWPFPRPVLTDEQWERLDRSKAIVRGELPGDRVEAMAVIGDLGPLAARANRGGTP